MKTKILIGLICLLAVTGLVIESKRPIVVNVPENQNLSGVGASGPSYLVAATSSSVVVGPQQNIQIVATSSLRTYLEIMKDLGDVSVYCRGDNDMPAIVNNGIKISTSTDNFYVWSEKKGNNYVGGLRCTASASTTVLVTAYTTRQ